MLRRIDWSISRCMFPSTWQRTASNIIAVSNREERALRRRRGRQKVGFDVCSGWIMLMRLVESKKFKGKKR